MTSRHLPLVSTGIVLLLFSVAPTVIGMVRGFNEVPEGQADMAIESGVRMSFHPAFIGCAVIGFLLVTIGVVRQMARTSHRND